MDKNQAQHYIDNIPDFLKTSFDWIKTSVEEGKEEIDNWGGTLGVIVKIFGKGLIDKYYASIKDKKLDGFGYITYLESAFKQAEESSKLIIYNLPRRYKVKDIKQYVLESLEQTKASFEKDSVYLIFKPKEHPAVKLILNSYLKIFSLFNIDTTNLDKFIKDFNENIENTVSLEFGEYYKDHIKNIDTFWLKENETKLLLDTINRGKIGFVDEDKLPYETTYAKWEKIEEFGKMESEISTSYHIFDKEKYTGDLKEVENTLRPISELLKEYFKNGEDHIEKILFVIADFGKGKSVFMKNLAAQLASEYLRTAEGEFPIYFNLRNYGHIDYSRDSKLGVISNYLSVTYGINIEDEHF